MAPHALSCPCELSCPGFVLVYGYRRKSARRQTVIAGAPNCERGRASVQGREENESEEDLFVRRASRLCLDGDSHRAAMVIALVAGLELGNKRSPSERPPTAWGLTTEETEHV